MVHIPSALMDASERLKKGESVPPITPRTLLAWFSASRRGRWVVQIIRNALTDAGVRTEPDFEAAYIDADIELRRIQEPATGTGEIKIDVSTGGLALMGTGTAVTLTPPPVIGGAAIDPTFRIRRLASANKRPLSVAPDASVSQAVTLMLTNDYSQLPVMQSDRVVKGIVSWASIGARLALNQKCSCVRDCMAAHQELPADASLFAAIPTIIRHEYVLVRADDQIIAGIVTTSDLSQQFQQLTEPFLLLEEVENHVRSLIEGKFTAAELGTIRDPADADREVKTVADLALGEYLRLLEKPDYWQKLNLAVDRATFVKELDKIREIRNDVMHFDPDGIAEEDLDRLRRFVQFLQMLRSIGVV